MMKKSAGDVQRLNIIALLRVANADQRPSDRRSLFQRPVGVQNDIAIFDFIHQALNE